MLVTMSLASCCFLACCRLVDAWRAVRASVGAAARCRLRSETLRQQGRRLAGLPGAWMGVRKRPCRGGSAVGMRLLLGQPMAAAAAPEIGIGACCSSKEQFKHSDSEDEANSLVVTCRLLPWLAAQHHKFSVQGTSLAHSRGFFHPATADITNFAPRPLHQPHPPRCTHTPATSTQHGRLSGKWRQRRRTVLAPPQAYAQPRPSSRLPAPQLLQR